MTGLRKHPGAGDVPIFVGNPRIPETDMDKWYQGILTEVSGARKRPYLYGSDAGLCARRNVLLEHNSWMPSEKSPATAAYMAIGVGLEDMLAEGLRRNDRLVDQGRRLITLPEVKISGKIDLITFDSEDRLALIEVKTCGELPTEAKVTHLAQIQLYAAVSGVTRCWLTYISRNVRSEYGGKLSLRTFSVETNKDVLKHRLQVALISQEASLREQLPPVPSTFRKHTECHYCEFRDAFCWGSRPGLGGEPPRSPLPPLSPSEYILLEEECSLVADSMVTEKAVAKRREKTISEIFKDKGISLSKSIRDRLSVESI